MQEFREFATRGSLIDVAVGIIIGAAVSRMVGALVDHILTPIIGVFLGGVDFSALAITVGDANIGYGAFIQAFIDFLIVAFVLFMILRVVNRTKARFAEPAEAPAPKAPSPEVRLLTEIRDQLARRPEDRPEDRVAVGIAGGTSGGIADQPATPGIETMLKPPST